MFAARCAGVSLALFLLLYIPAALAMVRLWPFLYRFVAPGTTRGAARLLFALRIFPFALALAFTFGFTLPSFLLLEPRATNEAVGTAPAVLGLCCLALLVAGVVQAANAQLKTRRALVKWLNGSTMMKGGTAVPVFRTREDAPSLTVAGVRDPMVLVSDAAIAALTAPELQAALKHELAHAGSYDNLKKLLFRLAAFPGMSALERAWAEQSELAADDEAVRSPQDALDLASALIKVSRLAQPQAALTSGLLHSSTALEVRIQRLVSWESQAAPRGKSWHYVLPPLAAATVLIATYRPALNSLHQITEWLVR